MAPLPRHYQDIVSASFLAPSFSKRIHISAREKLLQKKKGHMGRLGHLLATTRQQLIYQLTDDAAGWA
jgi:hypothetical protein